MKISDFSRIDHCFSEEPGPGQAWQTGGGGCQRQRRKAVFVLFALFWFKKQGPSKAEQ